MIKRLRSLGSPAPHDASDDDTEPSAPVFTGLRLFSAELLLSAGANATLHYLRSRRPKRAVDAATRAGYAAGSRPQKSDRGAVAAAWVPLLLGAAACAAQIRHALEPSERRHTTSTVLNGAVVGLGAAGALETFASSVRGERAFSVAPLLFGYTGVLGFLLDRQETTVADEAARLERRARLVERWVPKRRDKINKIVVHV